MTESEQLASRMREVIFSGTWVAGTNFKAQLTDLNWESASLKVGSVNSIAALTSHIHYYVAGILNVLKGGTLDIKDKYSFDFPPLASKRDWDKVVELFFKDSEEFITKVALLSDKDLDSVFVDKRYGSYRRNIDALIEHAYYHLGQIVLLKKMRNQDSTKALPPT